MSATSRGSSSVREAEDFYETPSWCVEQILAALEPVRLLDPCAGIGGILMPAIDRVLSAVGYELAHSPLERKDEAMEPRMLVKQFEELGLLSLAERIAHEHHVSVAVLLTRRRLKSVVVARHALFAALHDMGKSYPEIGALFGFNATSVRSGVITHRSRSVRHELDAAE